MAPKSKPVIVWFRKDLRLDDNHALLAAVDHGGPVIPVYINEKRQDGPGPLGAAQEWWLHHSLTALSHGLDKLGSRLILRTGDAQSVLRSLLEETGAETVLWNRRYDPSGIEIDTALKQALHDEGLTAKSFSGHILHEPSKLKTKTGGPYRVYTPFWRAIEAGIEPPEPVCAPDEIAAPSKWPKSENLDEWKLLPTKPDWAVHFKDIWTPGEAGAYSKAVDFIETTLNGYDEARDFPSDNATSMLSPHLAMGEISPARIWHATRGLTHETNSNDITRFRKELVWRDFSYHLLFHFPKLDSKNWNDKFDDFPWRDDDDGFRLWTRGMTGYPIVDAGMRQLWKHGIMHNRVRMIVASFLIKHLMIDWRRGEKWFRDTLVDADPASNAASWQWVAGSGADASPFFRIFNPILQGEKFDGEGDYVREFVPELSALPDKFIHKPFDAPRDVLEKAGVTLGETYPKPIVEHAGARQRALSAYSSLTKSD